METIRLVTAALEIEFDQESTDKENFEREFATLNENDNDAIGQWLRVAKTRGEVGDTDPVILQLMVELYRKMDRLEKLLMQNISDEIPLPYKGEIESIGFDHFKVCEPILKQGEHYYGRVELPVHPKRITAVYFEAVDPFIAKIIRIHPHDENEWGAYMRARERAMIRHLKGLE